MAGQPQSAGEPWAAVRVASGNLLRPWLNTIVTIWCIGVLVFSETIDTPMLAGAAIIVTSGLYVLMRERR